MGMIRTYSYERGKLFFRVAGSKARSARASG
jgi:hypothetical protein